MAFDAHTNFGYATVATAPVPATSGLSLVVATGLGALFPAAPFNCTVWPAGANPLATNAEIVRVTAVAGDTFTIVRAQEGSSARTIVVGDQIGATITVKTITDVEDAADNFPPTTWVFAVGNELTITRGDVPFEALGPININNSLFNSSSTSAQWLKLDSIGNITAYGGATTGADFGQLGGFSFGRFPSGANGQLALNGSAFFMQQSIYAFLGVPWTANTFKAGTPAGEVVLPTFANQNGHVYFTSFGGTTGATEPVWVIGGPTTDGTVTWTDVGTYAQVFANNANSMFFVVGPTDPEGLGVTPDLIAFWPYGFTHTAWAVGFNGEERRGTPHAVPPDATVPTSTLSSWFDDTTGSPTMKMKMRDAAGTLTQGGSIDIGAGKITAEQGTYSAKFSSDTFFSIFVTNSMTGAAAALSPSQIYVAGDGSANEGSAIQTDNGLGARYALNATGLSSINAPLERANVTDLGGAGISFVPAGAGMVVPYSFEIVSGQTVDLAADGVLDII